MTLVGGFALTSGDAFTILNNNDDADGITGTFLGLPEGATLTAGTQEFQISYVGGTGNDVALTAVTPKTDLLVVSQASNEILRFDGADGAFISEFVASASGTLDGPNYTTLGPDGNLYVSNTFGDSVQRYDSVTGAFIGDFVGSGNGGLDEAQGMAFGPDGKLYVVSSLTNEVLRYDGTTGAFIDTFASGNGLNAPTELAFGPDGNLYVGNHHGDNVLRFDGTTGAFIDVFASGGLDGTTGLAFASDGSLYVGSFFNERIQRYGAISGQFLDTLLPFGKSRLDQPNFSTFGPDGNLYVSNTVGDSVQRYDSETGAFIDDFVGSGNGGLDQAQGATFGPDGKLYVVSSLTNEVLRYDGTTGAFIDTFASGNGLNAPTELAFGPDGNLYVGNHHGDNVLRFDGTTGAFIDVFASGGLDGTTGLAFAPDGSLYVGSFHTNSIIRYDGATGATIDEITTSENGFTGPRDVAMGPDGLVYVSSFAGGVIRIDTTTGEIATFVSSGSGGLDGAYGLAFGTDGNLYVSSWGNDGVLRYEGGTGAFIDSFVSPDGALTPGPRDVAIGPDGRVYASSFGGGVIRFDGTTGDLIGTFVSSGSGGLDGAYGLAFVPSITSVAGRIYNDANHDGSDSGDTGLGGLTVTLTGTNDQEAVLVTTTTLADGSYTFVDVAPGMYSITAEQPVGLLDGNETAGNLGGTVDNTQDSNTISDIVIGTDGVDATGYNFGNIQPSDLQGLVWSDFNNDGEVNFGEKAIQGVAISLSGIDDRGNAVNFATQTDTDGTYMFVDLRPGLYALTETQPAGFDDVLEVIGTVNGSPIGDRSVNDLISSIALTSPDSVAENYNFGERPQAGGSVEAGQTATIGFWQNNNGQALLESLNGSADSTQLADWLAATFPNMYGASAGAGDLSGMTNVQVADFYSGLFLRKKREAVQLGLGGPTKVDAQVLAVAFATYVTSQTLAGTTAEAYGFLVTTNGVGTATFNVSDAGQAFDVADDSDLAVLDLLFATNAHSTLGILYDEDGDGDADDDLETLLRTLANDVYSAINEQGDV